MDVGFYSFIENLAIKLNRPLPGAEAQGKMAPKNRNYLNINHNSLPQQSAVMLLLYPKNEELYIAYFKRPEYNGPHSGQIAFPGGKAEPFDSSLQETAIRETEEEFGISRQKIDILGSLTKLYIPISNLEVTPFVGYILEPPEFIPNKKEVSYIIEIPIKKLTNNSFKTTKTKHRHNLDIETPMYIFGNEEIWGATAMITSEFEEIIKETI